MSKLLKLNIQMFAKTLISTHSSYFQISGSNNPNSNWDMRPYFNFYYEQNEQGQTIYTMDVYAQYYNSQDGGLSHSYNITCNIAGESFRRSGTRYTNLHAGYQLEYLFTITKVVDSYEDGTGVAIAYSMYGTASTNYASRGSATYYFTPPTVNVSTTISNNTSEDTRIDFGNPITFNLTRPNTSVTEEIKYTINEVEYSIPITSNGEKEQEISYTFPTTLIELYPNTDKPYIQVNLTSSNGTKSSTNVYLNIDDTYKPTIGIPMLTDVMENKPESLMGLWIKNKSKVFCSTNITPLENATITNFSATISDFPQMYIENPFTTQPLSVSGERIISINVVDSRGKKSTKEHSFNVIDYNTPSIEGKVERCLSDGTLNENGTYGKITVKYKVYPLNNGTSNLNSFTIKMTNGQTYTLNKGNYEDTITQVINLALSSSKSYKFTFEILDIFGEPIIVEYILGVANKTISLRKGGKGVTIGKIATADGFNIYMGTSLGQNYDSSVGGLLQAKGKQIIDDEGNVVSGGDTLPVNSIIKYDGDTVPDGYEEVDAPNKYSLDEQAIGTWVDGKPLYRKIIDFGALPTNGSKNVATNINDLDTVTNLSGISTNGVAYLSLPYAHVQDILCISLYYNDGNIGIETASDRTSYTSTKIIIEYTKTTD